MYKIDWKVKLSNNEVWTRKSLYKKGDVSELKRLIRYLRYDLKNEVDIVSFCIFYNGGEIELLDHSKSTIVPHGFWFMSACRFCGALGCQLQKASESESISCIVGDKRVFYWLDCFKNTLSIQYTNLNVFVNEDLVRDTYGREF